MWESYGKTWLLYLLPFKRYSDPNLIHWNILRKIFALCRNCYTYPFVQTYVSMLSDLVHVKETNPFIMIVHDNRTFPNMFRPFDWKISAKTETFVISVPGLKIFLASLNTVILSHCFLFIFKFDPWAPHFAKWPLTFLSQGPHDPWFFQTIWGSARPSW